MAAEGVDANAAGDRVEAEFVRAEHWDRVAARVQRSQACVVLWLFRAHASLRLTEFILFLPAQYCCGPGAERRRRRAARRAPQAGGRGAGAGADAVGRARGGSQVARTGPGARPPRAPPHPHRPGHRACPVVRGRGAAGAARGDAEPAPAVVPIAPGAAGRAGRLPRRPAAAAPAPAAHGLWLGHPLERALRRGGKMNAKLKSREGKIVHVRWKVVWNSREGNNGMCGGHGVKVKILVHKYAYRRVV